MKLELNRVTSHLRIFIDDNKSTGNRDPYDTIITVQHISDTEVHLSGLKGVMNREILKEIEQFFREQGVTTVTFERHGKQQSRKD
jgi:hypothetical protein